MSKIADKIVKTFGNIVTGQVCANPVRVRRLLAVVYGLNGWRNTPDRQKRTGKGIYKNGRRLVLVNLQIFPPSRKTHDD